MKKLLLVLLLIFTVIGCGKDNTVTKVQKFQFDKPYVVSYIDGSTFDINTGLDAVAYVAALCTLMVHKLKLLCNLESFLVKYLKEYT